MQENLHNMIASAYGVSIRTFRAVAEHMGLEPVHGPLPQVAGHDGALPPGTDAPEFKPQQCVRRLRQPQDMGSTCRYAVKEVSQLLVQ